MKIREILNQHRRDFWATYECVHCGHVTPKRPGYDDANFHQNVIPKMECPECGKTAGDNYRPLATRYPDGMTV